MSRPTNWWQKLKNTPGFRPGFVVALTVLIIMIFTGFWRTPGTRERTLLHPISSFANRNYISSHSKDVAALSRPTGFLTIKPKDIGRLKSLLTNQHITFNEVPDLGLVRVKESDWHMVASADSTSLADQVQPEVTYTIAKTPNDPQYPSESYLSLMQTEQAWDLNTGTPNVTVAVLDTGVMGNHVDLSGKMVGGYDYVNNRALSGGENSDDEGHGTLVAGILAASSNNGVGIAAIDWGAHIMPVKVIDSTGSGTDTNIAVGLRWAVDHGARVVNMSFGGGFSQTLKDQVDYAASRGVVMAAAAGNTGTETTLYPAGWDNVIAVGSVASTLARSSFSTYNDQIDIVAPGEGIISTNNSGGYLSATGTSVATPFVTATASLLLAQNPSLGKQDIINAIETTARDINSAGVDKFTGHGLLQIKSAIQASALYHYSFVSESNYPEIAPGQAANLNLTIRNTGSTIWQQGTLNLGTDRGRDRISPFARESGSTSNPSGWIAPARVRLQQEAVPPGSNGSFSFWFQAPTNMAPGTYREYFRPVADGITWLPEDYGIYWDIKVLAPTEQYRHQFVSQNSYPTLAHGQAYQFQVTVKNTGAATWQQNVVHLGTSRSRDRIPEFSRESNNGTASGWVSPNRIKMQEASVDPGGTATFSFWMRNDSTSSGVHRQYLQLVADGVSWMEDLGIYWDVTVP